MIKKLKIIRTDSTLIKFKITKDVLSQISQILIKNYGSGVKLIKRNQLSEFFSSELDEALFTYKPGNSGCYSIIISLADNTQIISDSPILIYSQDDIEDFHKTSNNFTHSEINDNYSELKYFPGNKLYSDWLVSSSELDYMDESFYKYKTKSNNFFVYTQFPLLQKDKEKHYLSGYQICRNKGFIFNSEQCNLEILKYLDDKLSGRFTHITVTENDEILIQNDFFGFEKIYKYQYNENVVFSNRLHLLLIFLKKSKYFLSINESVIKAILSSNIWMFCLNNFQKKSIFNEIITLPCWYSIQIRQDGSFSLLKKELYNIFLQRKDIEASDEREEFIRIASELKLNSYYVYHKTNAIKIADLTGGVDSRLSLSTLPILEKKDTTDFALRTLKIGKDWEISKNIASFFSLPFVESDYYDLDPILVEQQKRSWLMGTYFKYCPIEREFINLHKDFYIKFTGGAGEAFTRPYTCVSLGWDFLYSIKFLSSTQFIDQIFLKLEDKFPTFITSDLNDIKSLFKDELDAVPGNNYMLKFESIYMCYRTPYHFNTFTSNYNEYTVFPVVSPRLFNLFCKKMDEKVPFNFSIYLTQILNPILSCFSYDRDEYNIVNNTLSITARLDNQQVPCIKTVTFNDKKVIRHNKLLHDKFYDYKNFECRIDLVNSLLLRKIPSLHDTCFAIYLWNRNCSTISKSNQVSMLSRLLTILDQISFL
ncbi:hypothetical protein [Succinatimonas hippei]|uniref:hypothetical protein n=1 Tax=Succinatimonas hippei TaxID=626938 RepID=UPI0026EC5651|nr:hypothetical protein [Succinatimonas hippei]